MEEQGDNETPLGRYYWWFTGAMLAFTAILAVLNMYFDISSSGPSLITPFIAAMFASERFVTSERRAPSEDERKRLTFGNLGIYLLFNALVLLGLISSGGLQVILTDLNVPMDTFMILFMSVLAAAMVLNFLLVRWAYGGLAQKRAGKLEE